MEGNEYMNGKSRKQISEVSILIIVIDIVDQTVTTERREEKRAFLYLSTNI